MSLYANIQWSPEQSRTSPLEERWQALCARRPRPTSLIFRLVCDRAHLTDAEKWVELCNELDLSPPSHRNVGDVLWSLTYGKGK